MVVADNLRSRIIGNESVDPQGLVANPFNWRVHPRFQQDALEESLETLGWIQQPIVNRRNGHVIDGHLRVQVAIRRGEKTIPVLMVDLTEAEERQALASIDPLATLAVIDSDAMTAALQGVTSETPTLAEFFDGLRSDSVQRPSTSGPRHQDPKAVSLRALIAVSDVELLERALAATGESNRGEALLALCRSYLHVTGSHNVDSQDQPPAQNAEKTHGTRRDGNTRRKRSNLAAGL